MLKSLVHGLVIFSLLVCAAAIDHGFPHCNCDVDGFWTAETILQFQKVSDFLIAVAYFSIPIELLCFVTCANLDRFRWIFLQFGAFIVLCGLTHLLNFYTYDPHSFIVMLSLTVSKLLTALVSIATAITFLTLIPQLLRVKVREYFLLVKAQELNHEVGMMKRQEETSWHVRMLTQEIRKSLDRHTILYTTLVELSKTLGLENCVVWMPDGEKELNLTHALRQKSSSNLYSQSVPIDDPDVLEITNSNGVKILSQESLLCSLSSGGMVEPGTVVGIRLPMLKVCNFKGGTPELVQTNYGILVLVLPADNGRTWSNQELEIIEVVADQVAVALSHAAVLEESQVMREKLVEQNQALLKAQQNAMMAAETRNRFQVTMSQRMRRPVHSILGLLSMMQQEKLRQDQRLIINTMLKSTGVVTTMINDLNQISATNSERISLVMSPFNLHSMIKEAVSAARCLCDSRGLDLTFHIERSIPSRVVGDEKRIFHVLLHMIDTTLNRCSKGPVTFQVLGYNEDKDEDDQGWTSWKSSFSDGYSRVKFEIATKRSLDNISSLEPQSSCRPISDSLDMGLSFRMCKRIVQMMQGNIWAIPNPEGDEESIMLVLPFQSQPLTSLSETRVSSVLHLPSSVPDFKGLRVLLADSDDINRAVTRKLVEKLGCHVTSVTSGLQCLSSFGDPETPYQLVILALQLYPIDGFEVAMRIRKFQSGSWPVIVALTARSDGDVWDKCRKAGMNGLIQKPITLQALEEELYRVLRSA